MMKQHRDVGMATSFLSGLLCQSWISIPLSCFSTLMLNKYTSAPFDFAVPYFLGSFCCCCVSAFYPRIKVQRVRTRNVQETVRAKDAEATRLDMTLVAERGIRFGMLVVTLVFLHKLGRNMKPFTVNIQQLPPKEKVNWGDCPW